MLKARNPYLSQYEKILFGYNQLLIISSFYTHLILLSLGDATQHGMKSIPSVTGVRSMLVKHLIFRSYIQSILIDLTVILTPLTVKITSESVVPICGVLTLAAIFSQNKRQYPALLKTPFASFYHFYHISLMPKRAHLQRISTCTSIDLRQICMIQVCLYVATQFEAISHFTTKFERLSTWARHFIYYMKQCSIFIIYFRTSIPVSALMNGRLRKTGAFQTDLYLNHKLFKQILFIFFGIII